MKDHMRKSLARGWLGVVALLFCFSSTAMALTVQPEGKGQEAFHRHKFERRKAELLQLKKEDPEKFKVLMTQKRHALRERLAHLKETDPEKYKKIVQKIRQRRLARWQRLKKENPQEFQRLTQQRREHLKQRLEVLKKENPEKYQEIMAFKQEIEKRPHGKGRHDRRPHRDELETSVDP